LKRTNTVTRRRSGRQVENYVRSKTRHGKPNINEERKQIREIMLETADDVLGRTKVGKRAEWITLQTLKIADERRS